MKQKLIIMALLFVPMLMGMEANKAPRIENNAVTDPIGLVPGFEMPTSFSAEDVTIENLTITGTIIAPGVGQITHYLTVKKGPSWGYQEYRTINEALATIIDNSSSSLYVIKVEPGIYVESEITLKPYVALIGESPATCVVQTNNTGQHCVIGVANSVIQSLTLMTGNPTNTGYAAFDYEPVSGGTMDIASCWFGDSETMIKLRPAIAAATSGITITDCTILPTSNFKHGVEIIGDDASHPILAQCNNLVYNPTVSFPAMMTECVLVTGLGADCVLFGSVIGNDTYIGNKTGLEVSDGGVLSISSSFLGGFHTAISVPELGSYPPSLNTLAVSISGDSTYDVLITDSFAYGTVSGQVDKSKVSIIDGSPISLFYTEASVNPGCVLTGPVYTGPDQNKITNISPSLSYGGSLGVLTDGILTMSNGLFVTVNAGSGYLEGADIAGNLKYVTWTTQTLPLAANTSQYLFVATDGTVHVTTSMPSTLTSIYIGNVYTTASSVLFIQNVRSQSYHTASLMDLSWRDALGSIYQSGSLTTTNVINPLQLDIGQGSYFYGTHHFVPSSATAATWSTFYKSGTPGVWTIGSSDTVDTYSYDDNSGTLQPLGLGNYTQHELYICGDRTLGAAYQKYFLVYGQDVYSSYTAVVDGNLPIPPTYFEESVVPIASIIVTPAGIAKILDQRPQLAFKAGNVTGTAVHGDLLGLTADDHLQYLNLNGVRAMAANFNMGGNNILNASMVTSNAFTGSVFGNVDGNLMLPITTSAASGLITQNSSQLLHTYGTNNLFLGNSAGNFTLTGTNDIGIGMNSLNAVTSGVYNAVLGYNAADHTTSGGYNTIVGANSLTVNTTGAGNTAVGYQALSQNNASNNVAVGMDALQNNTAGDNTAVGYQAAQANTSGTGNTAVGYQSLAANLTTINNTAVGFNALAANVQSNNTAVGFDALVSNTTGAQNVGIGTYALGSNLRGSWNTAVGYNALETNQVGNDSTALGYQALYHNLGSQNTAVGSVAMLSNTGQYNTAVGYSALNASSSGNNNTAVGGQALSLGTSGSSNVAVGWNALKNNTASNNTAVGYDAMLANTSGYNNTALGYCALSTNMTMADCTAVGYNALAADATGFNNTAIGSNALLTNTSGSGNTAVGAQALNGNINNSDCTAVGTNALLVSNASQNTAVGSNAMAANTSGYANVAVGYQALHTNRTGENNTAVGVDALDANIDGVNNTAVGYDALGTNTTTSNCTAVGTQALLLNIAAGSTAVGTYAMYTNSTGAGNTAMGYQALKMNGTGGGNTAMGYNALAINTASYNSAFGTSALAANLSGTNNTAIGSLALSTNASGTYNTAVGCSALISNVSGSSNTAFGVEAMSTNNSGAHNIAIGNDALFTNSVSSDCTAVGYCAGQNTTGAENTYIGSGAGSAILTGTANTIIGYNAGSALTSSESDVICLGANCTGIVGAMNATYIKNINGRSLTASVPVLVDAHDKLGTVAPSLALSTNGSSRLQIDSTGHVAISAPTSGSTVALTVNGDELVTGTLSVAGTIALPVTSSSSVGVITQGGTPLLHTYGTDNLFLGYNAGNVTLTPVSAYDNVGLGSGALYNIVTGGQNAAVGFWALHNNQAGDYDTALGYEALKNNFADNNTAVGYDALTTNTYGQYNTAVGAQVLYLNGFGNDNTGVGYNALYQNSVGVDNTALGYQALRYNIASANTAIGSNALFSNTAGTYNTAVGYQALKNSVASNGNTAIGYNAGLASNGGTNNVFIGVNTGTSLSVATADNVVCIGNGNLIGLCQPASTYISGIWNASSTGGLPVYVDTNHKLYVNPSSRRFKENIKSVTDEESDRVLDLRPVKFSYKCDDKKTQQYGLIAEEVVEVLPELVGLDDEGQPYGVFYQYLPPLMLNELQKQHVSIHRQELIIDQQQQMIDSLQKAVDDLREVVYSNR